MRTHLDLVIFFLIFILTMTGCTSVGVPYTANPEKKLRYAESLFNELDRPLPAQSLILEAIDNYKKNGDEVGLASAYRVYAFFLQSPSVGRWSKMSFNDKTINHENRYIKSAEYWDRAIELYDKNYVYNLSAHCYFQLEKLYYVAFQDVNRACFYNNKSKESIAKFRENNPNTKLDALGYESFEELIGTAREQLDCEK